MPELASPVLEQKTTKDISTSASQQVSVSSPNASLSDLQALADQSSKVADISSSTENVNGSEKPIPLKTKDNLTKDELGLDRKFEIGGEIGFAVKFKSLFGVDTTYVKFLKELENFNGSDDITVKHSHLKELKILAKTWQAKHIKEDSSIKDNEKRLEKINKFIDATTSNYKAIIEAYTKFKDNVSKFSAAPFNERKRFYQLHLDYNNIQVMETTHKSKYPLSVNPSYIDEINKFKTIRDNFQKESLNKTESIEISK